MVLVAIHFGVPTDIESHSSASVIILEIPKLHILTVHFLENLCEEEGSIIFSKKKERKGIHTLKIRITHTMLSQRKVSK